MGHLTFLYPSPVGAPGLGALLSREVQVAPSLSSGTSFGGEGGLLLQTCFSTAAVQAATSASGWTDGRLFWTRLGFCGLLSVVGFLGMGSHQPAF